MSVAGSEGSSKLSVKDESISPRWQKGSNADAFDLLLWVGLSRDDTLLAFHGTQDSKVVKIAHRLMAKPAKTGWDYYTYAVQSQKRLVHAVKFHIFQRHVFPVGKRVKLKGLVHHSHLNHTAVRILDYDKDQDKYLIRPTIPLPDDQKLSSTGQLLVRSQHIQAEASWKPFYVWSFCAIFNGKQLKEPEICTFTEKLVMLFEKDRDKWLTGNKMAAQTEFGPIIKAQMEQFCSLGEEAYHDRDLAYSNEIVARNLFLLSEGSEMKSPAEKLREEEEKKVEKPSLEYSDSVATIENEQ